MSPAVLKLSRGLLQTTAIPSTTSSCLGQITCASGECLRLPLSSPAQVCRAGQRVEAAMSSLSPL